MENKVTLKVQGRELQLGHVDKVLYPRIGFTKAHVIDYYIRISDFILPHLENRPLTLKLFLNGVGHPARYIKNAPIYTPEWIRKAPVPRVRGGENICFVLLNDLASLVWAAHLNNIEMHTLLARAPAIERPTSLVFDLDPGPPATILEAARAAGWLRAELQGVGLQSFAKSSGSKGIHVYVPLNRPVSYAQTQPFARLIAARVQEKYPDHILLEMSRVARTGKVFIDYSQNVSFKSIVAPYSLRARQEGPSVAMALTWDELDRAVRKRDASGLWFDPEEALARLRSLGDLLAPVLKLKQKLPERLPVTSPGRRGPALKPQGTGSSLGRKKKLSEYAHKRNFAITREPAGTRTKKRHPRELSFVIQKHAASHLHYDFRLEMEGVLRSWAVPKGPPFLRGEKRLAMHVEDHPLEYASFEGIIPAGQYGGGTVMLWDHGTYRLRDGEDPVAAYRQGKLHLDLRGKKLKGAWTLVKIRTDERGKESWFLIKSGEDARLISKRRDDQSVVSGRSMQEIAQDLSVQWQSSR